MVFEIMRPFFLMFGIEFYLFHSMLALFFLLFLFDDAVVILLARLYGMRMCRSITQCQGSDAH